MKNLRSIQNLCGAVLLSATLFTSCELIEPPVELTGTAAFEITDAPIDDGNVKGVFVTVTDVEIDGKSIELASKQTIDLLAYQNGDTKQLGNTVIETGTYSNVVLVLDFENDANGTSPGAYVLTNDNEKMPLLSNASAANQVRISTGSFDVNADATTTVVMDFDIRKAIKRQDDGTDDKYDFVTDDELNEAVRMVNKARTGSISGKINDPGSFGGDRIVVYAYQAGDWDKDREVEGQGASNVTFKKALTSSLVREDGSYTLSFLESGSYELVAVAYEDENNDGTLEVQGRLEVSSTASLNVLGLGVSAETNIVADLLVTGIFGF